jgi:tripartite ATP-independent transporter DctM subunit
MLTFSIATAILVITIIIGIPIAFAIALTTIIYILMACPEQLTIIPLRMFAGVDSFIMLCLPLFVIAAEIMIKTGISEKLFSFVRIFVGRLRGGVAYVNVGASSIFGSLAGAALADVAGLGKIEIDAMVKEGYSREFSCGVTAGSAIQSPLIPPSGNMVLYGGVMGLSIGTLLVAGFVPGLTLALLEVIWIFINRNRLKMPRDTTKYTRPQRIAIFKNGIVALGMPVIIVGGIVGGFVTPTEAAGIAVAYALLVGAIIWRNLKVDMIINGLIEAALSSAKLFMIVSFSMAFAWVMGTQNVPEHIAAGLMSCTDNPRMILFYINIILIIIGMWMDGGAAIILFAPILAPIATKMGINPYHFGVMMITNLTVGLITPPVGVVLYATAAIGEISFIDICKVTFPYMVIGFVLIAIMTLFPEYVLSLPRMMGMLKI